MTQIDYPALIRDCRQLALMAGERIMTYYRNDVPISEKKDKSPVTIADREGEQIILSGLKTLHPGIPVVSEEAASDGQIPSFSGTFFLVDPLDGTREFIEKNKDFTVNIALVENGKPTTGVVYAPVMERMFLGSPDGAFEEKIAPGAYTLQTARDAKPIRVRKAPPDGLVAVTSRSHRAHKTEEYLALYNIKEIKTVGSSLKFCLVATGEADIYARHGRTMEWDTAAGHAVLVAAGGTVTELDGGIFSYGKKNRGLDNPSFIALGNTKQANNRQ